MGFGGGAEGIGHRIETGSGLESGPEKTVSRELAPDERTIRARKISVIFSVFGSVLLREGIANEVEVYQREDVHAFYRLATNPDEVIHLQGYPGFSSDTEAVIFPRVMDYKKMQWMRTRAQNIGSDIKGNEHEAVIRADRQTRMMYSYNALSALLGLVAPEASISLERLKELGFEK